MKLQRSFFYIRPVDHPTEFYHEANPWYLDAMQRHVKAINPQLDFNFEIINDNVHRFNLLHPDHDAFKLVTQNLYFEGDLKQEFKNCMRWTKEKQIAFALSAHQLQIQLPVSYSYEHYYNIKTDQTTFIDATPKQKKALSLYDLLVGKPELIFTINFFDYKHNVKHVINKTQADLKWWEDFTHECAKVYPRFFLDKEHHNKKQSIISLSEIKSDIRDNKAGIYTPDAVREFLPDSLKYLELKIC